MTVEEFKRKTQLFFLPKEETLYERGRNYWGQFRVGDGERCIKIIADGQPVKDNDGIIVISKDNQVYIKYNTENERVDQDWYSLVGYFQQSPQNDRYYEFVVNHGFAPATANERTAIEEAAEVRMAAEIEEATAEVEEEATAEVEEEATAEVEEEATAEVEEEATAEVEEEATAEVEEEATAEVEEEATAEAEEETTAEVEEEATAEAEEEAIAEPEGEDTPDPNANDTSEIGEVEGKIQSSLREQINKGNKNIILTGAPGTGKTYAAKNFVDQYYEKLRVVHNNNEYNYNGTKVPYKFVQFHPSYDYTDFVQGIKPDKNGNFKLRDGVFKRFCDEVVKINKEHNTQNMKFFFIIDEINRADLSSVFGELMYSLEYRGKANKIELQYSYFADETEVTTGTEDAGNTTKDNMFYIPDNVVIIGTMNDIDRSVEAFDFALRRRFVWIEVSTDDTLDEIWDSRQHNDRYRRLDDRYSKDDDEHPLKRLKKLNNEIENKESLGKQYQIGGAYIKDIEGDDNGYDYDSIWRYRIEPLIGEYMRGVKDKESILKEWEKKFKNTEEDVTPVNDGVNGDELDEDGQN